MASFTAKGEHRVLGNSAYLLQIMNREALGNLPGAISYRDDQLLFSTGNRRDLFLTIRNAAFRQVIRRHFQRHSVAGQDADEMQAHFAADVGKHFMPVLEHDPKHCVRQ